MGENQKSRKWVATVLALALYSIGPGCHSNLGREGAEESTADLEKDSAARLQNASTDLLVARAVARNVVFVFDFDDTLLDHSRGTWAPYAQRAIMYLKKHGANIAICSANANENHALNRRLKRLAPDVFNDEFLATPAFQTGSRKGESKEKWDEIEKIMDHYGATDPQSVVYYDDNLSRVNGVLAKLNLYAVHLGPDALTRPDFRGGVIRLLQGQGGPSCGAGVPASDYCSVCGNCQEGEGDCDDDSECACGLVCMGRDGRPKEEPGHDVCTAVDGPEAEARCVEEPNDDDVSRPDEGTLGATSDGAVEVGPVDGNR